MSMIFKPLVLSLGIFATATATSALLAQEQQKPNPRQANRPALLDASGRVLGVAGIPVQGGGVGGKYGGRRGGRMRLRERMAPVTQAISRGLEWLRKHQDGDGGWDAGAFMRHDRTGRKSDAPGEGLGRVGITGFCLLPFLGDGSALATGPYREVVHGGVEFLRRQQQESGAYSTNLLEHAVATYAICEASGLSGSTILGAEVGPALIYLAANQNPDGGFSHRGKGKPSDAYTTLQAVLAYRSSLDFKLTGDATILAAVERWIDAPNDRIATPPPIAQGIRGKESVLAARLLAHFMLGRNPNQFPVIADLAATISEHGPADGEDKRDPVFDYLATYGLYQIGGRHWALWSKSISGTIVGTQRDDGNFTGSWDPMGPGAVLGGRLYATALTVLTAESYYRYTRVVR